MLCSAMLLLLILAPLMGSVLIRWIPRSADRALGSICAGVPALAFLALLYLLGQLGDTTHAHVLSLPWLPGADLALSFRLDGLSIAFGLLITGIGSLVCLYAGVYFQRHPRCRRFLSYIFLFMAAMLGVVFADNVLLLFVFWELTSIASYLLIGFEQRKDRARRAALQALITTGAGGLALLAGLILLGNAAGSYELSSILVTPGLQAHPHYLAIMILVLAGAATKSAQFPFHFWLPNAMAAPSPASAYLHSSTMVKAGVYLLARLHPALGGTEFWYWALVLLGAATMMVATTLALRQTELKPILAYSTIVALGTLVLCLGIGTPLAIKAFTVFLFVHAFYKAALFLVAGAIIHQTHETRFEELRGLGRSMPFTAAAGVAAALSMAGIPPLLGFLGKESIYEAALNAPWATFALVAVAVVANIANVYVAVVVGVLPFWRKGPSKHTAPHEVSPGMWLGPVVLGVVGLLAGLYPAILGQQILSPAASGVLGDLVTMKLKLWHGVNTALLLSLATLALSVPLLLLRNGWRGPLQHMRVLDRFGAEAAYAATIDGMLRCAQAVTRMLQHGYLRYYLLVVLACFIGAVVAPFPFGLRRDAFPPVEVRAHELITVVLVAAAAVATTRVQSRMGALACLGVVGYGISLLYVYYGAPDLAKTQIVVESLTVVFFALLAANMPGFKELTTTMERRRDAVIAAIAGGLMGVLVYNALASIHFQPVSQFYRENSLPQAHGRNVVNVILVDFRALDTLGELTVLAVAAFGAAALLRLGRRRRSAR